MSSAPATQKEHLLDSLRASRDLHPGLRALLDFHECVLEEQLAIARDLQDPQLPSEAEIGRRLDAGDPALEFQDLGIDSSRLAVLCDRLASVMSEYLGSLERPEPDETDWELIARDWYESRAGLGVHPDATGKEARRLVAGYGMVPILEKASSMLADTVCAIEWRRGYCPVCGGSPDFSVIGEESGRALLCGRCGTLWDYDRVGCPFCGEARPTKLAFYPVGDGRYRLHVCYSCHRYLKCMDLRRESGAPCIPLERILSAGLDAAAVRAGFQQV